MTKVAEGRVVIVGAGIAGLMTAYRLAEYGLQPVVIERSGWAADGATTRNQGWLHAGALHAQRSEGNDKAILISRRCRLGHQRILRLCPEAVESPFLPSIAITMDASRVDKITDLWQSANVAHKPISLAKLNRLVPSLKTKEIEAAWLVDDAVINTRLLCSKLVSLIQKFGGEVLFNAKILNETDGFLSIRVNDIADKHIYSNFSVITCGYESHSLIEDLWGGGG